MYLGFRRSRALNSAFQSSFSAACRPDRRRIKATPVVRKALLIGVSYTLEEYRLKLDYQVEGALTDVKQIYNILTGPLNFKKENVTVLTDGPDTPHHLWPTKANIEKAISTFVNGTSSGDICFLFYAGHGYQIYNPSSREMDKRDEHIVPCDAVDPDGDFIEGKMIIDDLLKNILVLPLAAADAKLTAVFDCCHSGTVLDLSHYRCNDITAWKRAALRVYRHIFSNTSVNLSMIVPCTLNSFAPGVASNWDPCLTDCGGFCLLPKRRGSGYVVCISACQDEESAWGGKKGGSLTKALVLALGHDPHPTLKDLNIFIGARVKVYSNAISENWKKKKKQKEDKEEYPSKIAQHPQFSSLWPLDMKQRFLC
ncbi:peptidase C14, caspase domain-containing protein [Desarmillaria tabescens]|uniref:Peptidase C14, caspase domain-containing protein n=1 Tax=Armillaria tabescens TaxID=1929756 RepID=A0AA39KCG9_ARMTA|nr:peptidase C14, caspase domain-containing protein [Desarmillaria tabescens]KAK0457425.1 peptidase C14, caspase domain-containing protein [Desarmillaria tabescens]